jgi:hypothetical protein
MRRCAPYDPCWGGLLVILGGEDSKEKALIRFAHPTFFIPSSLQKQTFDV